MKLLKLIPLIIISITTISCVDNDDYKIPKEADNAINPAENIETLIANGTLEEISIIDLKNLMVAGVANQITTNSVISGYVTSSDETGNFYQEFYMQDTPSNPTAGIKISLSSRDNYVTYNFGRKVYVLLKDLYIGEANNFDGIITIGGKVDDTEIDAMTENQIETHVIRSNIVETIVPLELKLPEINNSHIGMFVSAINVQFPNSLEGKPYFDPTDQFDSARIMQSCEGLDYFDFILETSEFASYADAILPTGNGTISGIITKNYNGSSLVIAINSPEDVSLTNSDCAPLDINDFTVIFEENFEEGIDNTNLDIINWTNFSEVGDQLWTEQIYSGNGYAEFTGYKTNDAVNIGWLVSPAIDISAYNNAFLNFKTAQHHLESDDNTLEVFISSDYDGANVLTATWETISANLATKNNPWYDYIDSSLIDVSSYSGNIYIGFKYTGSGTDPFLDGTYYVDDFRVLAK